MDSMTGEESSTQESGSGTTLIARGNETVWRGENANQKYEALKSCAGVSWRTSVPTYKESL
jgi:hypothetical protein